MVQSSHGWVEDRQAGGALDRWGGAGAGWAGDEGGVGRAGGAEGGGAAAGGQVFLDEDARGFALEAEGGVVCPQVPVSEGHLLHLGQRTALAHLWDSSCFTLPHGLIVS